MKQVSLEYELFCSGSGYFGEPHVIEAKKILFLGGQIMGSRLHFCNKLLTQPASSSCCERNWSMYFLIHNIKRNKLATSRAEDLVFVHYNLRLLSCKKEKHTNGPSKYWYVYIFFIIFLNYLFCIMIFSLYIKLSNIFFLFNLFSVEIGLKLMRQLMVLLIYQ